MIYYIQSEFTMKGEEMKETFLLRMPKGLKEYLETDAKNKGLTLTGLLLSILNEYKQQTESRLDRS